MANGADITELSWVTELETTLLEECDFGVVRNITKGRPLPDRLRAEVWQIFLNSKDKEEELHQFDGLFNLSEQAIIRSDCRKIADGLGNAEADKLAVVSDMEEIITHYCKVKSVRYEAENGWKEILQLLACLKLPKAQLFSCFSALISRYIPKESHKDGRPFHLFRLLLLYHDPQLCSFLDTRKISPDMYALKWCRSLLSSVCDLDVTFCMWDVYFQQADPFLLFFLFLVLLVNAKEQIMEFSVDDKPKLIEMIESFPSALEAEDIEDFCSLAQFYASKTPQSFRRHYQTPLFGSSGEDVKTGSSPEGALLESQLLCLPVSVEELLHANSLGSGEGVRYFVVDCRPASQYNAGHLPTAFHLAADLMLQNPAEFSVATKALTDTQKQTLASGSSASGEHLCFLGSGREEEDQLVHMVIAHFLQKTTKYVSLARGGYAALHRALQDNLSDGIKDHSKRKCIVCNPQSSAAEDGGVGGANSGSTNHSSPKHSKREALLGKLTSFTETFKSKSVEMKEKMINYIKNDGSFEERHANPNDRLGRGYRNMASVFSIGDDEDEGDDEEGALGREQEEVNLDVWLHRPDIKHSFECQHILDGNAMMDSHLLISNNHWYVLHHLSGSPRGQARVAVRQPLRSVVKITSKRRIPELITLKCGFEGDDGLQITDVERFLIPKAGDAVHVIKLKVLEFMNQSTPASPSSSRSKVKEYTSDGSPVHQSDDSSVSQSAVVAEEPSNPSVDKATAEDDEKVSSPSGSSKVTAEDEEVNSPLEGSTTSND